MICHQFSQCINKDYLPTHLSNFYLPVMQKSSRKLKTELNNLTRGLQAFKTGGFKMKYWEIKHKLDKILKFVCSISIF